MSGALPVHERPGLLAALEALEADEAHGLVVHRLDRLARELHVQEAALVHAPCRISSAAHAQSAPTRRRLAAALDLNPKDL